MENTFIVKLYRCFCLQQRGFEKHSVACDGAKQRRRVFRTSYSQSGVSVSYSVLALRVSVSYFILTVQRVSVSYSTVRQRMSVSCFISTQKMPILIFYWHKGCRFPASYWHSYWQGVSFYFILTQRISISYCILTGYQCLKKGYKINVEKSLLLGM